MTEHREKFSGKAAEYERYRERYDPEIVLPLLREWCGLTPDWTIADFGAGTGMLSDVFLANGNRVIAIEPNAEMRHACERLHEGVVNLQLVDGTAEATGLADSSVDMVAAGRAMHWFDAEASLREFRRVLKPGGWVAVIAAGRHLFGREENEAYEEYMKPYSRREEGKFGSFEIYHRLSEVFAGGEFHHAEIPGEMQVDWDQLRGLTLSFSYSPLPGDPRFEEYESGLRKYFEKYQQEGKITLNTVHWMNAGRFGDPAAQA
jgi:SAM-dependent methyltransferase